MSSDRFHKAAKDGLLDVLKEATRKETNSKDVDSMSPTLWAAFEGRLDALRLLVGRGGDPDKCDQFGNTALHLAAAKGHMNCVDFLVKFGVNLYALDIDKHTAKDLAAINNRDDILRYLDTATANFELKEKKKSKSMKELAEKNCKKRIEKYAERQQQIELECENVKPMPHRPSTMLAAIKHRIWSSSQGNLQKIPSQHHQQLNYQNSTISSNGTKFSELTGSGGGGGSTVSSRSGGTVQKKALASKFKNLQNQKHHKIEDNNGFKIGEINADGKRTITSLTGLQIGNSDVLYVGTINSNEDTNRRGKITDVFDMETNYSDDDAQRISGNGYNTLSRSFSQPDFMAADHDDDEIANEMRMQRPAGLFDRPMLGSISFSRSVTAALSQLNTEASSIDSSSNSMANSGVNSAMSTYKGMKPRSYLTISDSDTDGACDSDDEPETNASTIQRFLAGWGLEEHLHIFQKQQIDLDTLMLLTEADLKSLGLPLGPFRKLVIAIQDRKNAIANPGAITDSRL